MPDDGKTAAYHESGRPNNSRDFPDALDKNTNNSYHYYYMTQQRRFSKQRQVILEVLRSTTSHPTAEWVYTEAKKRLPRLSLGTIYRNLRLLTENGGIQELELGSPFSRYDGNPESHTHFLCRGCGRVLDIDDPAPPKMNAGVAQSNGLKVTSHRLTFYGLCQVCRKEKV